MDSIKQRQNLGYVIAGSGALVALLAFLLLPFVTITVTVALSSVLGGSTSSTVIVLNATALTQSSTGSGLNAAFHVGLPNGQGVLWFLPILSLVALILTGLLLFREHPFGRGLSAPVANQRRWGDFALIGIAVVSALIAIITFANLNGQIQNQLGISSSSLASANVNTSGHVGFWLYLLGILALAGGAILMVVQANKQAQAVPPTSVPSGSPYQSWQSPVPPNPYSQQGGPQPYQPPQPQPYSSQQWPPSNPPQSPYPPGQ